MSNQVNVDEILKQAEQINNAVAKHNNENQKFEGYREATKKRLADEIKKYNQEYGTNLTLEDTEALQKEYVDAVRTINSNTKHLKEVLEAVQENDLKKVSELTGLNIEQETIKMPRIDIDMDEMEKQADKAFNQVNANTSQDNIALGFGVGAEEITEVDEEDEVPQVNFGSFTTESDNSDDEQPVSQPNIRSFFDGNKVSQESKASEKESQTTENTIPNFSSVFKAGSQQQEETKEEPVLKKPDFSNMFKSTSQESDNSQKNDSESGQIGSFLQGFNANAKPKQSPSASDNKKIEDALKGQSQNIPTFNFGSIDIDED